LPVGQIYILVKWAGMFSDRSVPSQFFFFFLQASECMCGCEWSGLTWINRAWAENPTSTGQNTEGQWARSRGLQRARSLSLIHSVFLTSNNLDL